MTSSPFQKSRDSHYKLSGFTPSFHHFSIKNSYFFYRMAGVWETLFYEEKQDWITTIINGVSSLTCCAVEIPCAILALISTCLIMSWEFACQSAQQVSDFLGLEEWWTLEHSLWAFFLLQVMVKAFKGGRLVLRSRNLSF